MSCRLHDPTALPHEERVPPSTHGIVWVGGSMGPRVSLVVAAKKENPHPARNRTPVVLPVLPELPRLTETVLTLFAIH